MCLGALDTGSRANDVVKSFATLPVLQVEDRKEENLIGARRQRAS